MKPQTLTTLCRLQPGDIFQKSNGGFIYQKIEKEPIRKGKHLYTCFACRIDRLIPVPMKATQEVLFIKNLKETA